MFASDLFSLVEVKVEKRRGVIPAKSPFLTVSDDSRVDGIDGSHVAVLFGWIIVSDGHRDHDSCNFGAAIQQLVNALDDKNYKEADE